jgi:alpha-galactosidase
MDPLTSAVCTPPEISQMVDEMLVAQARWLPQYRKAIPAAKARFASEERLGLHGTEGAARMKTKTVDEMRQNAEEARRNAGAADKAMAQRKQAARLTRKK